LEEQRPSGPVFADLESSELQQIKQLENQLQGRYYLIAYEK